MMKRRFIIDLRHLHRVSDSNPLVNWHLTHRFARVSTLIGGRRPSLSVYQSERSIPPLPGPALLDSASVSACKGKIADPLRIPAGLGPSVEEDVSANETREDLLLAFCSHSQPLQPTAERAADQGDNRQSAFYSLPLAPPPPPNSWDRWCRRSDLNRGPTDYESVALPLSYVGVAAAAAYTPRGHNRQPSAPYLFPPGSGQPKPPR